MQTHSRLKSGQIVLYCAQFIREIRAIRGSQRVSKQRLVRPPRTYSPQPRLVSMSLLEHQNDHRECLRMASELLGTTAVAVDLSWSMEQRLRRQLQLEARCGIGPNPAMLTISDSRSGHQLAV